METPKLPASALSVLGGLLLQLFSPIEKLLVFRWLVRECSYPLWGREDHATWKASFRLDQAMAGKHSHSHPGT